VVGHEAVVHHGIPVPDELAEVPFDVDALVDVVIDERGDGNLLSAGVPGADFRRGGRDA
jgi:hypothetical protein